MRRLLPALLGISLLGATMPPLTESVVRKSLADYEALKSLGPAAVPHLVHIYNTTADEEARADVAEAFYVLGVKSPEAREALLRDINTNNPHLRLQVQWALGRVSDDTEVVDILAGIMRNDTNPLFRDKAACALAYDQIHLTEKQKVRLYGLLIDALKDPKQQVRAIAIQALKIQTGQDKGFDPSSPEEMRIRSIAAWKRWLAEYEKNL